jgi:hypothetical protein
MSLHGDGFLLMSFYKQTIILNKNYFSTAADKLLFILSSMHPCHMFTLTITLSVNTIDDDNSWWFIFYLRCINIIVCSSLIPSIKIITYLRTNHADPHKHCCKAPSTYTSCLVLNIFRSLINQIQSEQQKNFIHFCD